MKEVFSYIVILGLLFLQSQNILAQEKIERYQGLRIGADIAEVIISGTTSGKNTYMVFMDYEFKEDLFAVLEIGGTSLDDSNDSLSYTINGNYGLVGLDLNAVNKEKRLNDDILHYGLRYGFSLFSQDIELLDDYSGDFDGTGKETLSAHWAEVVTGAKAELWFFKNVFIGLSVRAKFLISREKEKDIPPSIIPGYGDASKGVNFDINWTVSYRIPFKKTTIERTLPPKK